MFKIVPARRAYNAAYYQAHKEEARAYDAARYLTHGKEKRAKNAAYHAAHKEERAEFIEWLQILRTNNGCEDCGTHGGRLVHHHVDPATKRYSLSSMYGHSLDSLEDELERCVVLCWSCHKYRHDVLRGAAA